MGRIKKNGIFLLLGVSVRRGEKKPGRNRVLYDGTAVPAN
jgi:hypothetical protein